MSKKSTLTLPERLDISQTDALMNKMEKVLSKDSLKIELKAEKVERADSAGIQLLLSFQMAAIDMGKEVSVLNPSEDFLAAADLLGARELLKV